MNRRSLLAASGTLAGASLFGRSASAQQAQIKGCGATFPRQVFQAWAGVGPTSIKMTYEGTTPNRSDGRPPWGAGQVSVAMNPVAALPGG